MLRIVNVKPPLHGREQSPAQLILGMVVIGVVAAAFFAWGYWALKQ